MLKFIFIGVLMFILGCGQPNNTNGILRLGNNTERSAVLLHNDFFENQAKSIVRVSVPQAGYMGTGIVIYKDSTSTYILTDYHVIEGATSGLFSGYVCIGTVGDYDQFYTNHTYYNGVLGKFSVNKDLAVVKINKNINSVKCARLSSTLPSVGTLVFQYGLPKDDTLTLTNGIISRYLYDKSYIHIQTSNCIWHGMSGGPLFTSNGEVVGILQKLNVDNKVILWGFSDYISSYEIIKFLKDNDYKYIN